jgi:ATP-dependent RNA helicase RhlE
VGIGGQITRLRDKVDIISACPGRLLDHIQRNTIDLSHVEVLVLDEADHMFDMGFLPDVRKIVKHLPKQRQTLLFSATMPNDIKSLANDLLQNPVNIEIGHAAPVETVTHKFYPVQMSSKTELLKNILDNTETDSVLVFTRTKSRAKSVAQQLDKSGYKVTSLHGNLSQQKRQQSLDGFRDGRYEIMVATDIASKIGDAFTFVTADDAGLAHSLERVLGEKLQLRSVDGLTIGMPSDKAPAHSNRGAKEMKFNGGKKLFSARTQTKRRPARRSFDNSNRSLWSQRSPMAV